MKILYPLLMLAALLASCGKKESSGESPLIKDAIRPLTTALGSGSYEVSCFINKAGTIKNKRNINTMATLSLNNDGNGLIEYTVSHISDCSHPFQRGHFNVTKYKTILIDEVTVLEMELISEAGSKVIWVPYTQIDDSIFMDLSNNEDDSGAYLLKPHFQDLAAFIASPENFTEVDEVTDPPFSIKGVKMLKSIS